MRIFLGIGIFFFSLVGQASAQTITNTVSFTAAPANVETYDVEKQVGGAAQPWVAMPPTTLVVPNLSFQDAGNTPGVQVCYRVTPQNSLPSTGASAEACSITVGVVGDMPPLTIVPMFVP